jgi:hypothetical protein
MTSLLLHLAVALALVAAPRAVAADLTSDLCGALATPGSGIIDTVEERLTPVPHCFLHGTLGLDRRFRIQLPATWNGKFVLGMGGGWGGDEFAAASTIGDIVLAEGYAYAESNQGRPAPIFKERDTWQELHLLANRQLTEFATHVIAKRYGAKPRRSYLFGSSGGGWRALAQLERYPGVYDGAGIRNPAIEPRNLVFTFSVFDRYFPAIRAKLAAIVAARDRGEDPFALLTESEATALNQIYDAGLSRGGEFHWPATDASTIGLSYPVFRLFDPAYFEDFWTRPGYAGHDGEVTAEIIDGITGTVTAVGAPDGQGHIVSFTDSAKAFAVNSVKGFRVTFTRGALAGQAFHVGSHTATQINVTAVAGALNGLSVGATYTMDNHDFLAWQHYHRHLAQCAFPEYQAFCAAGSGRREDEVGEDDRHGQAEDPDDEDDDEDEPAPRQRPLYVQRPPSVQKVYREHLATMTGRISAPVVTTNQDLDHLVWPPIIHRYFQDVRSALGRRAGDMLRVYWNEHHIHGNPAPNQVNRIVERDSSWHLAFQLMVRWVEQGIAPPPDTVVVNISPGHVVFPATAADRKGLQPTVSATANGVPAVTVARGSTVAFDGVAASPIGEIAKYEWDFEGNNQYDCDSDLMTALPSCDGPLTPAGQVRVRAAHVYEAPGTYLATVRVHDDTDNPGPFDGIENLARVIVIVQ